MQPHDIDETQNYGKALAMARWKLRVQFRFFLVISRGNRHWGRSHPQPGPKMASMTAISSLVARFAASFRYFDFKHFPSFQKFP